MIESQIKGITLRFETQQGLFSPNAVDKGTLAMLSCVDFTQSDKVLDLGCGYGVVGILAAKLIGEDRVVMSDNDERAVACAKRNAVLNDVPGIRTYLSDGVRDMDEKDFTLILSNPPYHEDFSVAKAFIEKGFNRLAMNGRLFMVTKREVWYRNKLTAIFGGVRVFRIEDYFVFMAEKRGMTYANKKEKIKPARPEGSKKAK